MEVWRLGGQRRDEGLHTVSIPSASLLHIRELRCVIGPRLARGGCGMVQPRYASAFLLRRTSVRTLPVTSQCLRCGPGWDRGSLQTRARPWPPQVMPGGADAVQA